jgi:UDP-N-acetyl-2-amino-2-deoxyglucuronate dehydrogenase
MYREILAGRGFGLNDARPSVEIVYKIRKTEPVGITGDYHPFLAKGIHPK